VTFLEDIRDMESESSCFSFAKPALRRSSTKIGNVNIIDEEDSHEEGEITCGEELFRELCEAAIENWLEKHQEELFEQVVGNYNLQPKKKKQKLNGPK